MVTRWLLATVLLLARAIALREQKFATEPQDQTAVVGNRATLPCRVINKSGLLQWTKDGFGLGNLSGFTRYSLVGNVDEGQSTKLIVVQLLSVKTTPKYRNKITGTHIETSLTYNFQHYINWFERGHGTDQACVICRTLQVRAKPLYPLLFISMQYGSPHHNYQFTFLFCL